MVFILFCFYYLLELFHLNDSFEETNELVSTMTLFPYNSSLFLYGTNTGLINICDLRTKSYCDKPIYSIFFNNIYIFLQHIKIHFHIKMFIIHHIMKFIV